MRPACLVGPSLNNRNPVFGRHGFPARRFELHEEMSASGETDGGGVRGGAAAAAAAAATVRTEASAAELTEYLGRGTVDVRQLDITNSRLDQVRARARACVLVCVRERGRTEESERAKKTTL